MVTCLGAAGSVHLAVLVLLDRTQQRLCSERIVPRTGRGTGVAQWVSAQTVWVRLAYDLAASFLVDTRCSVHSGVAFVPAAGCLLFAAPVFSGFGACSSLTPAGMEHVQRIKRHGKLLAA